MTSQSTLLVTTQTGTSAYESESNEFGGGAQLLKDINVLDDSSRSNAGGFTEFDGQLFFSANDGITGRELWVSDGTTEGTQLLVDINKTAYVLIGDESVDTFQFDHTLLDEVSDTDTIQNFESEDVLDFADYVGAGGSVNAARITSGFLRIELSGEDAIHVFGQSNALDIAENQL